MNRAKDLSDAYAKSIDSNNYKLLQLLNLLCLDFHCDLLKIFDSRDLNYAVGKTLDRYGEMLGIARGNATDDQYRINIIGKIGRLTTDGSCNDTINRIADVIGEDPTKISIVENEMSVEIRGLSMKALEDSGYSSEEVTAIIKELIPICVALEKTKYAGTLLVMGDVQYYPEGNPDYSVSYDANGNYQVYFFPWNPTGDEGYTEKVARSHYDKNYPTLQHAWYLGKQCYETGKRKTDDSTQYDVGLSGHGEIPAGSIWQNKMYDDDGNLLPDMEWSYVLYNNVEGDFNGGTLGILSGEEWSEEEK